MKTESRTTNPLPTKVFVPVACPIAIPDAGSGYAIDYTGNLVWRTAVTVANASRTGIVRYDVKFVIYDIYNREVQAFTGFSTELLAVGDTTDVVWDTTPISPAQGHRVEIYPVRAAYLDGATWP